MGDDVWSFYYVHPSDPILIDRTGGYTVAVTDPETMAVYVADTVAPPFLYRVVLHEMGHCAMYSYGLVDELHSMCRPSRWVDAEEWVCNFIADYGARIFASAYSVLGDMALYAVPSEIERLVA